MKWLIFTLIPIVLLAYVLNKYFIVNVKDQWTVYFLSEGLVSVAIGILLVNLFRDLGLKLHTAAAVIYLILSVFSLLSEALGDRAIGGIMEPIWVGLTVVSLVYLAWKASKILKTKNHTQA